MMMTHKKHMLAMLVLTCGLALMSLRALGGVKLDEDYPVSRFGVAKGQTDGDKLGTSQASARDGAESSGSRAPASEIPSVPLSARGVQEVGLVASDLGYFPKVLFLTRNIPVRLFITAASKGVLCFMMDDFQIRKQIRTGEIEEITFTPVEPGKYRFHCPMNSMEGTFVVRDTDPTAQ